MLVMVWVLSSFLDNIAGALIGGAMAHRVLRQKVHIGYLGPSWLLRMPAAPGVCLATPRQP
jgi:hypothetical protein